MKTFEEELVSILKRLQIKSMGVDTDLPAEDNVANLIDHLHFAEVQIIAAHQAEMDRVVERIIGSNERVYSRMFDKSMSQQRIAIERNSLRIEQRARYKAIKEK